MFLLWMGERVGKWAFWTGGKTISLFAWMGDVVDDLDILLNADVDLEGLTGDGILFFSFMGSKERASHLLVILLNVCPSPQVFPSFGVSIVSTSGVSVVKVK